MVAIAPRTRTQRMRGLARALAITLLATALGAARADGTGEKNEEDESQTASDDTGAIPLAGDARGSTCEYSTVLQGGGEGYDPDG